MPFPHEPEAFHVSIREQCLILSWYSQYQKIHGPLYPLPPHDLPQPAQTNVCDETMLREQLLCVVGHAPGKLPIAHHHSKQKKKEHREVRPLKKKRSHPRWGNGEGHVYVYLRLSIYLEMRQAEAARHWGKLRREACWREKTGKRRQGGERSGHLGLCRVGQETCQVKSWIVRMEARKRTLE